MQKNRSTETQKYRDVETQRLEIKTYGNIDIYKQRNVETEEHNLETCHVLVSSRESDVFCQCHPNIRQHCVSFLWRGGDGHASNIYIARMENFHNMIFLVIQQISWVLYTGLNRIRYDLGHFLDSAFLQQKLGKSIFTS